MRPFTYNQTHRYDIQPDGALTNKTLFCNLGSDGMTIDDEGDIYVTGNGVTIFDKAGKQIGFINVPEAWTGSLCFGGPDHKTLYIAASTSLYSIPTRVRGANPAKQAPLSVFLLKFTDGKRGGGQKETCCLDESGRKYKTSAIFHKFSALGKASIRITLRP